MQEFEKQVDRDHYSFGKYYSKARWSSLWHQMDEVFAFKPKTVLEVGGGLGIFKKMMGTFDVDVTLVDIAEDLQPDIVGSVTDLPLDDGAYDVACAFQVLEHISFEFLEKSLSELKRVARRAVVISLPDAKPVYPFKCCLPKLGRFEFVIPKPFVDYGKIPLCVEHEWEVNRPRYLVEDVLAVFADSGMQNVKTFRVNTNTYHRFFIASL